jgi:predicted acylesterase/phospholipase RssA
MRRLSSFLLLSMNIILCVSLNQLSFSGGGSFGAVEIGILKRLNEIENKKYDLYTGISAGALNSGILSYFENIDQGIEFAEKTYTDLRNHDVYELLPSTGLSIFNTNPLHNTLTKLVGQMPNNPRINTLIGATNLYSGNLDVYTFEDNDDINKVRLMMSSSAIPGLFPPIIYKGSMYADGGALSNALIQAVYNDNYMNITYITPNEGVIYNSEPITSLKDMLKRTVSIIMDTYNDPLSTINQDCRLPVGEINKYYVKSDRLKGYNIMNFDRGSELIDIGYYHMEHKKYRLC